MMRISLLICSLTLCLQLIAEEHAMNHVTDSFDEISSFEESKMSQQSESSSDDLQLNEEDLEYLTQMAQRPPAWYDPFLDRILNKIATIPGFIQTYAMLIKLHDRFTVSEELPKGSAEDAFTLIKKEL